MHPDIPELNSVTCPLDGIRMIEAAAGTGKTYNIQNLVLRLVLERDLPVSTILVVTYTEAATAELQSRIRDMFRNALHAMTGGAVPDRELPRIRAILEHAGNFLPEDVLLRRLRSAYLDFDAGTVSTIHGFCQRMLAEYAFESGGLFDTVIRTDQEEIIRGLLTDFYRREFYAPDNSSLRAALQELSAFTPGAHFKTVARLYARPDLRLRTRAQEPFDTVPVFARIVRLLKEVAAAVHPGVLTGFGDIMNKGYYPADCAEGERILLEWRKSASFHGVLATLKKFSPELIQSHISGKKRAQAAHVPECLRDPFFAKNAELLAALQLYCDTLLPAALRFVRREFERKKRKENFLTFDDLLLRVRAAVRSGDDSFVRAVRGRYRAAIVDEFQDTDPVQYEIFHSLFGCGPCPTLFMVGDPRQAIYAFRGGDIAAYRVAESDALDSPHGGKYGLTANYRSSGAMIRAVNTVFHDHPYPFADPGITFAEIRAPAGADGNIRPGLLRNEAEEPFPLKITWLPPEEKPPTPEQLAQRTIRLCAKEIRTMLDDSSLRLPDRTDPGVRPGDFTVLVFSGDEGKLARSALAEYGIPSVIAKACNVFDSEAAGELEYVLDAIADPGNASAVPRAMKTDIIGYELPELIRIHSADGEGRSELPLDGVQEKLERLRKRWENSSFAEMFHELQQEFKVREHILGKPGGERKLTDLLHLGEILHHESAARSLSVSGLLSFLKRQRSDRLRERDEEYEIQLETDRAAVRIMTVHKSKGLEFPLVMLPTLFAWNADKHAENYHLPDGRLERDFTNSPESAALASGERLQELLRLAYVAITRAKYFCHIFWGACKTPLSALDWIFRMRTLSALPALKDLCSSLAASRESVLNAVPPDWFAAPLPETEALSPYLIRREEIGELHLPVWNGKIDPCWRITSYSGLISGGTDAPVDYDHETAGPPPSPNPEGIFTVPGGVRTGNAWHEIFEKTDFQAPEKNLAALVEEKLSIYGVLGEGGEKTERISLTMEMIRKVLASPLPGADGGSFTLSEISRADRVSEMQFHYCLAKGFRIEDLRPVLEPYVTEKFGMPSWNSLRGTISGGFLNGFIDLVFQHGGRFYLADWKSNRLGGDPRNFQPDGIRAAMLNHFYFLQYLIYSAALIKFLRLKIGTYAEEEHERYFGGVYYLFVRGITPDRPGAGVYYDRPPFALLAELEQRLG